jgi:pantetheine-phosphate adenylyltransferase
MGHLDIIQQASKVFSRLYVAIGQNTSKTPLLDLDDRLELLTALLKPYKNIEVISYKGMTVDVAAKYKVSYFVRGLRNSQDFDYEQPIAWNNAHLAPEVRTIFFITHQNNSHISSSIVREIHRSGGSIKNLVPPLVFRKLSDT